MRRRIQPQTKKRQVYVVIQGGLADQLKRYFAGLLIARKLSADLVIEESSLSDYHLGERTALKGVISSKSYVTGSSNSAKKRIRLFARGQISKYLRNSRWRESVLSRYALHFVDFVLGFVEDLVPYRYDTESSSKVLGRLRWYRFRRVVVLTGYFPSLGYMSELTKEELRLDGLDEVESKLSEAQLDKEIHGNETDRVGNCIIHFRVGDNFTTYKSMGLLPETYYVNAIDSARSRIPNLRMVGVTDNLNRAKELYPNLDIEWLEQSDTWQADQILKIFIEAEVLIQSHSGLSTLGGVLSVNEKLNIAPLIQDGCPSRPHMFPSLTGNWVWIATDLWFNP